MAKKSTSKTKMELTFEVLKAETGRLINTLVEGKFPTYELYRRYCYIIERLADLNQECEETIEEIKSNDYED